MNKQKRRLVLTFVIAGFGAVITEHMLKPSLKRRLHV